MENRGTLMRNTKPFGSESRPGEKGTRTRTGRTDTGRTAVGRAGSFNPEEPRSSRFRSYGPSLREERLRSSWPPALRRVVLCPRAAISESLVPPTRRGLLGTVGSVDRCAPAAWLQAAAAASDITVTAEHGFQSRCHCPAPCLTQASDAAPVRGGSSSWPNGHLTEDNQARRQARAARAGRRGGKSVVTAGSDRGGLAAAAEESRNSVTLATPGPQSRYHDGLKFRVGSMTPWNINL